MADIKSGDLNEVVIDKETIQRESKHAPLAYSRQATSRERAVGVYLTRLGPMPEPKNKFGVCFAFFVFSKVLAGLRFTNV